jgi:hypothetical protein
MITRKPKPTVPPPIEWPTPELQLVPVTVEHKMPARTFEPWKVEAEPPVARSLPHSSKITLH